MTKKNRKANNNGTNNGTNNVNGGTPIPPSSLPIPELPPGITLQLTPKKDPSTSTTPFELSKLSLPLSLNEFFSPFIKNIPDCIIFLERFAEDNDSIARVVQAFKSLPPSNTPDLDAIADLADLTKGELRRLLNSAIDLLCDEEAIMMLRLSKSHIVKKSIEIALDDNHEYSYQERKALLEYFGYRLVPKNTGMSINVNSSTNTDNSKQIAIGQATIGVVNGLPSFAERTIESEALVADHMKEVIDKKFAHENEIPEGQKKLPESSAEFLNLYKEVQEQELKELKEPKEPKEPSIAELLQKE